MIAEILEPNLKLMKKEYVLVHAWKKTVSYIRSHNWYADTLELDRAAVNLPEFLAKISDQLDNPYKWNNISLRIVPAPKSQEWQVISGKWEPLGKTETSKKIRPLAHVSLKDQVVTTALMLCLANRVETYQGDSRGSIKTIEDRREIISYGNRLFCDNINGQLHHRWGSTKLYRSYFHDYKQFLSRPEMVASTIPEEKGKKIRTRSQLIFHRFCPPQSLAII